MRYVRGLEILEDCLVLVISMVRLLGEKIGVGWGEGMGMGMEVGILVGGVLVAGS